jgi:hypothetical protein
MAGRSAATFEQLLVEAEQRLTRYTQWRDRLLAVATGGELMNRRVRLTECAIKQTQELIEYFIARLADARARDRDDATRDGRDPATGESPIEQQ